MAPIDYEYAESLKVLRRDPRFARLIRKHGPPKIHRGNNIFQALVRSIIYQQLSGKAAATIYARFVGLFDLPKNKFPTPEQVHAIDPEKLRSAGLSAAKVTYIKDVAEKFADGTINPRLIKRMSNEEILEYLVPLKGVGIWTVHMILIFYLDRRGVLPVGDLGVRKGMMKVYNLRQLPTPKKMEQLAKPWRHHSSVASWYLWRASEEK